MKITMESNWSSLPTIKEAVAKIASTWDQLIVGVASQWTDAAYFTAAVAALRNGQGRALDPDLCKCSYLTPDGRRCVVGTFIPDGHPGQACRGSVAGLLAEHPDLIGVAVPATPHGATIAANLQRIHDDPTNWVDDKFNHRGEDALKALAYRFGLAYSSPLVKVKPIEFLLSDLVAANQTNPVPPKLTDAEVEAALSADPWQWWGTMAAAMDLDEPTAELVTS